MEPVFELHLSFKPIQHPLFSLLIMRKSVIFFILLLAGTDASAQRELNNPLINSKEIFTTAAALYEKEKYKEAITEYLKVPESDTAYADVLHEIILNYYRDSNFTDAEKYARKAMQFFPEKSNDWYGLLADIYDDTKRPEPALSAYDSILAVNPYSYLTYFNKGISYFRQAKMEEATANFQQCIMLNPFYASGHYFLGRIQMEKGNLVQGMMSFAANLLVMPGNRYKNVTVGYLDNIAQLNKTVEGYTKSYKPARQDDFEMLQDILTSKIALDSKYKLNVKLEDPIVRQLQVMMEKMEVNAGDKGFWANYYAPMFKKLWDDGYFEPFIYYMFSELDIKAVKDYVKKEKKKIEAATEAAVNYLSKLRETQELAYTKRDKAATHFYIKNYLVTGKGAYGKNAKNEEVVTGPWQFYYSNGRLKSTGIFDGEGRRQGEWQFFYENGTVKEISRYADDKANGKSESWYDNGLPYKKTSYVNDEVEGIETEYFYSGMLKSVTPFSAGKKEGTAKYYNINGYLKTVTIYQNDLQEGEEITYHGNGAAESKLNYAKDIANGMYTDFFDNGKKKSSGNYVDGKKTGTWNTWYKNSQPEYLENYTKGELDGEYASWYKNGQVETKSFYRKGEVDGKKEDFDDDGIKYAERVFEKGRLKDIQFFDKKQHIISSTSSRKGDANITFYTADGSKLSDGYYSREGLLEGKGNYFYKNGQPSQVATYKNGLLEGKRTLYYENGNIKQEGNYTKNNADGYFTDYYLNGGVAEEGWYVDGQRQGTIINRNLLGNFTSKTYYLNNEVHGITQYFFPAGKPDYKLFYDNGWFNKIEQYDSTGKIISSAALTKGEGKIIFRHFNGTPYVENNYKNYKLNGPYKISNGDGSKVSMGYYKNGDEDSVFTGWHPNGKIRTEGRYSKGSKSGQWKYYWYHGTISTVENYEDGKENGTSFQYNEDGSIDKEIEYKDGEVHGKTSMYADNKQLAIVYFYKHGTLTGYSYQGKDGNLVPEIPITKGSGKVLAYFKNGIKSAELEFKEYQVDGQRTLYYSNGKEYISGKRINGLEHGLKKIFYPDGKLMKEENYAYGKLHGRLTYYAANGTLLSDVNYYLGEMHGECHYYAAGKLTDTVIYYYGVLESKK